MPPIFPDQLGIDAFQDYVLVRFAPNAPVAAVQIVLYRSASYPTTPMATTQTQAPPSATAGRFCFSDVDAPENYIVQVDYPTPGAAYSTTPVAVDGTAAVPDLTIYVKDGG